MWTQSSSVALVYRYPEWPLPGCCPWSCSQLVSALRAESGDGKPSHHHPDPSGSTGPSLIDCQTAHLILETRNELACLQRIRTETPSVLRIPICLPQYAGPVTAFRRMWKQYTHWQEPGKKRKHSRVSRETWPRISKWKHWNFAFKRGQSRTDVTVTTC